MLSGPVVASNVMVLLLGACGGLTSKPRGPITSTPGSPKDVRRLLTARELNSDSFGDLLVTSYRLHKIGTNATRVQVWGTGEHDGGGAVAGAVCYLSYGRGGALIESTEGSVIRVGAHGGFPIIGIATFPEPVPRGQAEDIYCALLPAGATRRG